MNEWIEMHLKSLNIGKESTLEQSDPGKSIDSGYVAVLIDGNDLMVTNTKRHISFRLTNSNSSLPRTFSGQG